MDDEHPGSGEEPEGPVLLRLFAGYADSPLWSVGGPVPLGGLPISAALRSGLSAWEAASYGGDGLLGDGRAPGIETLCLQLAAELGAGFIIEVSGSPARTVRGAGPGTSPDAAAALRAEAGADRRLRDGLQDAEHVAVAPLSGATFSGRSAGRSRARRQ